MPNNSTVYLPNQATIGETEAVLVQYFLENGKYPDSMIVDFSECIFIEVSTMMLLIALFSDRVDRKLETIIKLPTSKRIRDVMRTWNFPDAISRATGRPFSLLVTKGDLKYFGENPDHSHQTYQTKYFDDSISHLVHSNFFSIISFSPAEVSKTRLVTEESKRWEGGLIRSVLAKHLNGPDGYMASRVVYESMTNAARHPGASLIQVGSKFCKPGEQNGDQKGHFTISFWDDGRSMIDTLFSAITSGPVRSKETPQEFYKEHLVVLKDHTGTTKSEFTVFSGQELNDNPYEYEVLFAATFPGITSDIEGKEHNVHEDVVKNNPEFTSPGMGLYVLLNTAIDIFGGSVAFRTKNYFMNVKKRTPKSAPNVFKAKIQYFDEEKFPPFKGNLITVRLPLN